MPREDILSTLFQLGAYREGGHFVYTSGTHGTVYINKDAIYPHTKLVSTMARQIAEHYHRHDFEVVIGPAVGGVVLSQWLAYHLSGLTGREVLSTYADKRADGSFIVRRGYDKLVASKRVLLADDIINQGKSVRAMKKAIEDRGGEVRFVACLVNRGGLRAEVVGVKEIFALLDLPLAVFPAKQCPMCRQKIPIDREFGHGQKK